MTIPRIGLQGIALVLSSVLACLPPVVYAADLNTEMNSMFNSLGGVGNYTAPGAFKSQALNTFTGGNLYMRVPQKSYQLASIAWPSAKGGCNGIDVFGGSFSHISGTEFRDALQNITSALPGIAFQLAVDAVSDMLGSNIKQAMSMVTNINNARINSCETAAALVDSVKENKGFSFESSCIKVAVANGWASDNESAKKYCSGDAISDIFDRAATSSPNPAAADLLPFFGNVTWDALKNVSTLDDQTREIIMNIVGSYVYYAPKENLQDYPVGPTIESISTLLYGNAQTGTNIAMDYWSCNNYTACDKPTKSTITVEPLTTKVVNALQAISQSVRARTAIPNNTVAIGLVNNSSLPLWRVLSIGNSIPNAGLADTLIDNYKDVVAADFAFGFLKQFNSIAMDSLNRRHKLTKEQVAQVDEIKQAGREFQKRISDELHNTYKKLNSVSNQVAYLEQLERSLRSNMSMTVLDMLGYSKKYVQ